MKNTPDFRKSIHSICATLIFALLSTAPVVAIPEEQTFWRSSIAQTRELAGVARAGSSPPAAQKCTLWIQYHLLASFNCYRLWSSDWGLKRIWVYPDDHINSLRNKMALPVSHCHKAPVLTSKTTTRTIEYNSLSRWWNRNPTIFIRILDGCRWPLSRTPKNWATSWRKRQTRSTVYEPHFRAVSDFDTVCDGGTGCPHSLRDKR